MNQRHWTLAQANDLDRAEFIRVFGPVFEHSPWIAEAAWTRRPFASLDEFHQALCETVARASAERQVALIRAHPDLVGQAAMAGTLTAASASEQAGAGLDHLTPVEVAAFQDFNHRYRERFGFPFVICARRNKKQSILAAFPVRLQHDPATEVQAALAEIFQIARFRLADLLAH